MLVLDDSAQANARLSHPLLADVVLDALRPSRSGGCCATSWRRWRPARCRSTWATSSAGASTPGMDVSAGDLLATAPLRPGRRAGGVAGAARLAESGGDNRPPPSRWPRSWRWPARDAAALLGGRSGSARERCRREVDLALVLAFGLNRSWDGAERLELLLDDVDDDQWGYVAGQIPLMWLLAGEIHEARRAAEDVLADARSSGADRLSAELVLIPALNLLGLPVSALDRAAGCCPGWRTTRRSTSTWSASWRRRCRPATATPATSTWPSRSGCRCTSG